MPTAAGYSGTPLAKKLGIKEGSRVLLVNAFTDFESLLDPLPADVKLLRRSGKPVDVIVCFCFKQSEATRLFPKLTSRLSPAGGFWFSWPKRSSGVKTDITEDVLRELILPTGYVDNKVCAVDETWSGLRFVLRKELR